MKFMAKLPEGYGAAAPEGAAVYAKKKTRRRAARVLRGAKGKATLSYRQFVKEYLKTHKGAAITDAAKAWKTYKATGKIV